MHSLLDLVDKQSSQIGAFNETIDPILAGYQNQRQEVEQLLALVVKNNEEQRDECHRRTEQVNREREDFLFK